MAGVDWGSGLLEGLQAGDSARYRAMQHDLMMRQLSLQEAAQERLRVETELHLQNLRRQYQRENFQEESPDLPSFRSLQTKYPDPEASGYVSDYAEAARRLGAMGPRATMPVPGYAGTRAGSFDVPTADNAGVVGQPGSAAAIRNAAAQRAYSRFGGLAADASDAKLEGKRADNFLGAKLMDMYKEDMANASKLLGQFADIDFSPATQAAGSKIGIRSQADLRAIVERNRKAVKDYYRPLFRQYGLPGPIDVGLVELAPAGAPAAPAPSPAGRPGGTTFMPVGK